MRLAKEKKPLSESQERFAGRVAQRILQMQRSAADWLNERTRNLHPRVWLALLALFCADLGGYFLRLILQAFN